VCHSREGTHGIWSRVSTFKAINKPLREGKKDELLKATTYYIYEGLKKLRAVNLKDTSKFEPRCPLSAPTCGRCSREVSTTTSALSTVALCHPKVCGQQENWPATRNA
jgi:hypothetical protein